MSSNVIIDGLLSYIALLIGLTFHEAAHAWVADRCGDDTPRLQGRVTLNPIMHMDMLGTVVLPLLAMFLAAGGSGLASFIIGWGKPVQVNPNNFGHRRRDDTLVSLAGPAANLLLAVVVVGIARLFLAAGYASMTQEILNIAIISLLLCVFNLLPIPPLDGSHLLKNVIGMSEETYMQMARFGFLAVILIIQVPQVRYVMAVAVKLALGVMVVIFRF